VRSDMGAAGRRSRGRVPLLPRPGSARRASGRRELGVVVQGCLFLATNSLAPRGARQGDTSRAWQHLETANRLQRARIHYSPAGADALLRTLRDLFLMPPDAGRGVGADAAEMSSARATLRVRAGGASRAGRDAPERR